MTPTSFLAGEYFKALRSLLGREAPPASIGFVGKRKGVFADVLQETLLATYRRGGDPGSGTVHFISSGESGSIEVGEAGTFSLPESSDQPWLMPRTEAQGALLSRVGASPCRLADYGYKVSTGPLGVEPAQDEFAGTAGRRALSRWSGRSQCAPMASSSFVRLSETTSPTSSRSLTNVGVVTDFPCVLLQRTTAREQCRRLIAAELPSSFLKEHGAVVVENHLNMVKPINGEPKVSATALAALLNSEVADQIFRCINGSVAVSAYELQALPLPPLEAMKGIEPLVQRGAGREALEQALCQAYGCEKG